MFTGFRRYVNAGNLKLLVGTIGVTATVAVCSETPKPRLGSFTASGKENLYAVSKTVDDTTSFVPVDLWRSSLDKIVSVSHCHEAGECCKESAKHDGVLSSATESSRENVVENRVVELSTQSFDEAVLKNDKDVFVVFYAPWCGYCKRLFPVWEQLAQQEHSFASSVVVSQMDMTQHQVHVPGVVVRGYPTIYLFKKGHKGTPIEYRGGRDVVSFSAFLKYYTSI